MATFDSRAKEWDLESRRVQNAKAIAEVIGKNIPLNKDMQIIDFGVGTGLLSYFLSDRVGKVLGIDNSNKMLEVFESKKDDFKCKIEAKNIDIFNHNITDKFDAIISSMTIHHIKDIKKLFEAFYELLKPNGYIALADLESEDGSFHSDNTGVEHFGFDFEELSNLAKEVGFTDIKVEYASSINKPNREYIVNLLIAKKPQ